MIGIKDRRRQAEKKKKVNGHMHNIEKCQEHGYSFFVALQVFLQRVEKGVSIFN
jgi:hypothetical protein